MESEQIFEFGPFVLDPLAQTLVRFVSCGIHGL